MPALPLCDIGMSQDKVSWLDDSDVSALLNFENSALDLQSVPTASPDYLCLGSDSPLSSPFTPPYSSPELPEIEGSFVSMAPPLFDPQEVEVDMLFADSLATVNPELLPELEKILSSVDTSIISPPASPTDQCATARSSKKRKTDEGKAEPGDGVCLPRNQLLTMTSTEIEEYVSKLKAQRTLSAAEEKELKRQRRLIKNREYASQSRSRKKQYVDELEKALEEVRAENTSLKQQVGTLSDENKVLKKQISAIATTIKKSASLSSSTSGVSTLSKLTTVGAGRSNNTKTVSACLLAIMLMSFTFSAFWDKEPMFDFPTHTGLRIRDLKYIEEISDINYGAPPQCTHKATSTPPLSIISIPTTETTPLYSIVMGLNVSGLFDTLWEITPLVWDAQNQSQPLPSPPVV